MRTHHATVVMHINETLSADEVRVLEHNLTLEKGVHSACVSKHAQHLMLVSYNPEHICSFNLLGNLKTHGFHAQLIGGI